MNRWAASWRVAERIARRDAVRSRGRTALVATMIGLPVLVGAAGGTLLQSAVVTPARQVSWELAPGVQARIDAFQAPGMVQAGDLSTAMWGDPEGVVTPSVAGYEASLAATLPAGDRLVRATEGTGTVAVGDGVSRVPRSIAEYPADDLAALVTAPVADGVLPAAPGEVALAGELAKNLGVEVGDAVTVTPMDGAPVEVTVSAVLGRWYWGGQVIAVRGALLADPADAHGVADHAGTHLPHWYVVGDAPFTWDDVRAVNALGSLVMSRAVYLDPPPLPPELAGGGAAGPDMATVGVAAGVAAIALVEAVLLIGPAFAVGARRSQRQLALFAATGADRSGMRRVVLASGVVIGFGSAALGVALGIGVAALVRWVVAVRGGWIHLPDLRVPWWLMPLLVVLGGAAATAAAAVPARSASRVDVVAALAGRRAEADPHPAVPIAGLVVAGLGVVGALVGATVDRPPLVVGGIVVLQVGVVLASGGLVSLVGRLAPRLGLAGRFAVRDAARQRGRTAPALAAVLAAIAGVTAALVFTASNDRHRDESQETIGVPGTVAVGSGWGNDDMVEPTAQQLAAAEQVLRAGLPIGDVAPVRVAVPPLDGVDDPGHPAVAGEPVAAATSAPVAAAASTRLTVVRAPDQECPLWTDDADRPRRLTQVDTRCATGGTGQVAWFSPVTYTSAIVDDGTAIRLLRVPGADRAADALAAGKAVVRSEHDLRPDGTVRVEAQVWQEGADEPTVLVGADLPAVVVDLGNDDQLGLVLPPQAVEPLRLTTWNAGLVATTTAMPTEDQQVEAAEALDQDVWRSGVSVQRPLEPVSYVLWILVASAFVVGLGATALAVALSAAESRADLATLGAVGAAPRMRRRIAAAQAGVLVVTGTVLGVVTGLVLGRVLVTQQRMGGALVDPTWTTVVPWPALAAVVVGMPLLAMGGAWLLTRSRLPMVRRVVG